MSDLLPKKIHYCWFGDSPLTEIASKCLQSWKIHLPDYEIKRWNEDNFNIDCNRFVYEAYCAKKYAFVSDYVRLYALNQHGGIYMDTDVEVIKNLDRFLKLPAFIGFEEGRMLNTGIIGAQKDHPWIKRLLKYYEKKSFYLKNGDFDLTTNVKIITRLSQKQYGLKRRDEYQIIRKNIHVFPKEYFCPKNWSSDNISITENTYTIHHYTKSWLI